MHQLFHAMFLRRQERSRGKVSHFQAQVAHPVSPIMHPDHVSSHLHSPKRKRIQTPYYKVNTGALEQVRYLKVYLNFTFYITLK